MAKVAVSLKIMKNGIIKTGSGGQGMTNIEKWKQKIAKATDEYELLEAIDEMYTAHTNMCCEIGKPCEYDTCKECRARWLKQKAEDEK